MNKSYAIAGLITLTAIGWMTSGLFSKSSYTDSAIPPIKLSKNKKLIIFAVRTKTIRAKDWQQEIIIRGKTEVSRSVEVKAETAGRVIAISAKEGKAVNKAEVLAKIDPAERTASLKEAQALLRQRTIEHQASKSLARKGFRADTKLAKSAAQLDAARARIARITTDVERTTIRVPFDGVLETSYVQMGNYLRIGDPVARVIDLHPMLVIGAVSEKEVEKLHVGQKARVSLINGQKLKGAIKFIGRVADPVTRTFRIEIKLPNKDLRIRDGLTSQLTIPMQKVAAHFLSSALLTLNNKGRLGVKGINSNNHVVFFPIKILANKGNGVWVLGLPKIVTLITVGHEYVQKGEQVDPIIDQRGQLSHL